MKLSYAKTSTGGQGGRPMIMGTKGVVSSGHYLATEAGMRILRAGGNAFDAAVAVGFALSVVQPQQYGIGGEAPTLVYSAAQGKAWAISGHGTAPAAATIAKFRELGVDLIPGDGLLGATVPSAVGSWITLLRQFGTLRLEQALAPAIELADDGFVMYDDLWRHIKGTAERFRTQWPTSAKVFMPGGQPPMPGQIWKQPDWARTFRLLAQADRQYKNRIDGLSAAYDVFYRGAIARAIVDFSSSSSFLDASKKSHTGLLTMEDFAAYEPRVEEPLWTNYRGVDVAKCGPWTQGPVLLQCLNLLEGYDLAAMGHLSADYIHTVVECMKLAFADREFYYGDPLFVPSPMDRLLSKDYAATRRKLVDPRHACGKLRAGDQPPVDVATVKDINAIFASGVRPSSGDTTKLEVIDRAGNMVSATPSGGWLMSSPVVGDLGFPLGTRGQMFSLVEGHPNALAPGKRPRTTLTPSLAMQDGRPLMVFGSPGGDSQDQWALQFLLNVVDFGLSLQEAVEAPTFCTDSFPSSFYPRAGIANQLQVDGRVPEAVRQDLAARGHVLKAGCGCNTLAAAIDHDTGALLAAASPRFNPAYAAGW